MGPDLWNILYNSLLRLDMPGNTSLVAYTEDVALVIIKCNPALAKLTLNRAMRGVSRWMADDGLMLAIHKTELTLLTGKRIPTRIPMTVGTEEMRIKGHVKYLEVTLDTKQIC